MNTTCTENILEAPIDEMVCWCSSVSKRAILNAIHYGAYSIDAIRRTTGACTLGRCRELSPRERCCSREINELIEAESKGKGEGQ